MPRYFFHLMKVGEIVVRDETGHECANDRAAREHAQRGDDLIAARALAAASLKEHSFQVANEAGQVLFTVPLPKLKPAT
jgi:hypothetical protein